MSASRLESVKGNHGFREGGNLRARCIALIFLAQIAVQADSTSVHRGAGALPEQNDSSIATSAVFSAGKSGFPAISHSRKAFLVSLGDRLESAAQLDTMRGLDSAEKAFVLRRHHILHPLD